MKIFPEKIRKAAFVALSGVPDKERIEFAVGLLEKEGISVVLKDSLYAKSNHKYLASDIETRVRDIHSCWTDRSIDIIIAVRGGYGSAQLLPYIDWNILSGRKLPFIGYSDMTAFHLAMCSKGAGIPVSAPMIQNFPTIFNDNYTLNSLESVFHKEQRVVPYEGGKKFKIFKEGAAQGKLYPVTLSVLVTLIGTPFLPDLNKAILLVEDINEPVYKLDRYFTQLEQAGILRKLAGLLAGNFYKCGNLREREILFREVSEKIAGPVISEIPFGHKYPRISVVFESKCTLYAGGGKCEITIKNREA